MIAREATCDTALSMTGGDAASSSGNALRRPLIRALLRVALTVIVLWLLIRTVDVEAGHFSRIQPLWVLLGVATTALQVLGIALRWRFTAARLGVPISLRTALREYYVSFLVNQLLPSGIAGDALRAVRHGVQIGPERAGYGLSLRIVVLERLAGQLVTWLLVLLSAPLWLSRPVLLASLVVLLVVLGVALSLFLLARDRGWLPGFVRLLLVDAVAAWFERRAWLVQVATSALTALSCIAMFGCAAHALSAPLGALDLVRIAPLALASMTLPISFAGWGLRELATSALYAASGLDPAMGTATSVLYGLMNLAGASPGAFALLWPAHRAGPQVARVQR
jgi:uncharacterized membrane protein YbhN (UPF0104 family)